MALRMIAAVGLLCLCFETTTVAGYCADPDCSAGPTTGGGGFCDPTPETCASSDCYGVWCPDATCDAYTCIVGTLKSSPESITGANDPTCCDDIDYCSASTCEKNGITGGGDFCNANQATCTGTECAGTWCPKTDLTAVAGSYCAESDCGDGRFNVWCDETEERCNSSECSNGVWCPSETAVVTTGAPITLPTEAPPEVTLPTEAPPEVTLPTEAPTEAGVTLPTEAGSTDAAADADGLDDEVDENMATRHSASHFVAATAVVVAAFAL